MGKDKKFELRKAELLAVLGELEGFTQHMKKIINREEQDLLICMQKQAVLDVFLRLLPGLEKEVKSAKTVVKLSQIGEMIDQHTLFIERAVLKAYYTGKKW